MNFTYNNHLKYSIGDREFGYRNNPYEKYKVTIGSIDRDHYRNSSYQLELKRIADQVYKDLGKDMVLFLSGGTDSEIVLRSFLDIGVNPRCVVIRFKDGYNAADVCEAVEITKDLNVKLEFLDFDVKDFYYSGQAEEFGKTIQCTQVTYLMVYYHILKLGCPAVMGGEMLLSRSLSIKDNYWYFTLRENEDASAMRFSNLYNIPLVNEWFSYTPEIMLYYLDNPYVRHIFKEPYKLTSVSSKNIILKKLCPEIRTKIKTHGFEKLLAFNYEAYKELGRNQIKRLEPSLDGIDINTTIKLLRGTHDN